MTATFRIGVSRTLHPYLPERSDVDYRTLPETAGHPVYRWDGAFVQTLREVEAAVVAIDGDSAGADLLPFFLGREVPVLLVAFDDDVDAGSADSGAAHGIHVATPGEISAFLDRVAAEFSRTSLREADTRTVADAGFSANGIGLANAAALDHTVAIESLLRLGVTPDSVDSRGTPALNAAIRGHAWDAVTLLLDAGANVNAVARDRGSTATCELAAARKPELLRRCLELGAEVDHVTDSGQTALMIAVGARDGEAALMLLDAGADAGITDGLGMSAAAYARLFGLVDVVERLS